MRIDPSRWFPAILLLSLWTGAAGSAPNDLPPATVAPSTASEAPSDAARLEAEIARLQAEHAALSQAGEHEKALAVTDALLALAAKELPHRKEVRAQFLLGKGMTLMALARFDAAGEVFGEVASLLPADDPISAQLLPVRNMLAMSHAERGQWPEAEQVLAGNLRMLALQPAASPAMFEEAHALLGITQLEQGKCADAVTNLRRAIELIEQSRGPDATSHHTEYKFLGLCLGRLGRHADAEQAFERALALQIKQWHEHDERLTDTLHGLAALHHLQGETEDARNRLAYAHIVDLPDDGSLPRPVPQWSDTELKLALDRLAERFTPGRAGSE